MRVPLADLKWHLGGLPGYGRKFMGSTKARWGVFAAALAVLIMLSIRLGDSSSSAPAGARPAVPPPRIASDTGPVPRSLVLTAALEGTQFWIGEALVGEGRRWQADTLAAAEYQVVGRIDTFPGCPTAADTVNVDLRTEESDSVAFAPRGCGRFQFPLTGVESASIRISGQGAMAQMPPVFANFPSQAGPIVLPAGAYRVTISGRRDNRTCVQFGDVYNLTRGRNLTISPRFICN